MLQADYAAGGFHVDLFYRHQMTALDFIAHRESGKPPTELTFWRERRVAGETLYDERST